jgi:hypothetical protein
MPARLYADWEVLLFWVGSALTTALLLGITGVSALALVQDTQRHRVYLAACTRDHTAGDCAAWWQAGYREAVPVPVAMALR